jgi:hypothetical protein
MRFLGYTPRNSRAVLREFFQNHLILLFLRVL